MRLILPLLFFGILNFGALALGGLFTGSGVSSDWYTALNAAPWTPPGWVFGAAWTTIMLCFTFFMAQVWQASNSKSTLITLFAFQWVLNVGWNPTFFHFQAVGSALWIIVTLTLLMLVFILYYRSAFPWRVWLLAPYFIWLCIATSLNAYIYVYN
jgi:tryptophan-rich sensory protein